MSSLRAKQCPHCGGYFYRRVSRIVNGEKKLCCEHCGEPLHYNGRKEVILEKDRIQVKKVFDHFAGYMQQRGVFLGSPGSNMYMQEMGKAKKLINNSKTFLGYCSEFEIHPADFTITLIDHIFTAPEWASWAIKINTISMCNGNVFKGASKTVLDGIRAKREQEKLNRMHLDSISNKANFDVQYAV